MQIVFIYKYFWVIGVKKASNLRPPSSASVRTTSADNVRTRISTTCRWQTLSSFRAGCGDRFAHDETVLHAGMVHPSSATNTSVAVTGTAVLMLCNPTILRSASMPSVSAKSVARTSTGCASVTCTPPSARRVA